MYLKIPQLQYFCLLWIKMNVCNFESKFFLLNKILEFIFFGEKKAHESINFSQNSIRKDKSSRFVLFFSLNYIQLELNRKKKIIQRTNEMPLSVSIKAFKQKSLIFLLLFSAVSILHLVCSFFITRT